MSHPYELHRFVIDEMPALRSKSVLDVGCGRRTWGCFIRCEKYGDDAYMVGFDLFLPYISFCKRYRIYDDLLVCDARYMPFRDKSFHVVLASELIEHLSRRDGEHFLREVDRICKEEAILTTPNGFRPQNSFEDDVVFHRHISSWSLKDFKSRGYKVHGLGLKGAWYVRDRYAWGFLRYLFTPFSYIFPHISEILIASKRYSITDGPARHS